MEVSCALRCEPTVSQDLLWSVSMNPGVGQGRRRQRNRYAHEIWWVFWRHPLPMAQSSGTV